MSLISKLAGSRRPLCTARTGRGGGHCGHPIQTGRLANGHTCGRYACQMWVAQHYA